MHPRGDDNAWVAQFLLAELSSLWSCASVLTRDELTERERAAQLAERQATRLFAKARKIRAVMLPGEPVERRLFPRVTV